MFRISASVDGVTRALDLFADEIGDVDGLLRDFSRLKRIEVNQRFQQQGPGWAPLAASTLAKKDAAGRASLAHSQDRAVSVMRRKLQREYKRAVLSGDLTAIARRLHVKAEFERLVNGGSLDRSLLAPVTKHERGVAKERAKLTREMRVAKKAGNSNRMHYLTAQLERFDEQHADALSVLADNRLRKSIAKLPERMKRTADKYGGQVLGKIAASINVKVSKGTLVLASKIPWAGAHNEGDTVGKGSHLPARTFLEWTPADFDDFAAMAIDRGLAAFGG